MSKQENQINSPLSQNGTQNDTLVMRQNNKFVAVFVVLLITAALAFVMILLKPKEQKKANAKVIPTVEVVKVQPIDYVVPILSDGIVVPKTKITLAAEISGKVTFVAANFRNGGQFNKGDVLLKIDPTDYQLAITRAKANVASGQANLDLQQAKSDLAKSDWKKYGKKGKPNALNLNLPQVASAKATLSAAKADLQLAIRNLDKTTIFAPFSGVILAKSTDLGQFVTLATPLATIASTEVAEIRMSLTDEQLFNSSLDKFDGSQAINVAITSFESKAVEWQGSVVSIEAQRDAKTLFNYAVIEVTQPFSQQAVPLRFNSFVTVSLKGRLLKQVLPVERSFLLLDDKIRVLSKQSTLQIKDVGVIYADDKYKYLSHGINADDEIIITGLSHIKVGDKLKRAN